MPTADLPAERRAWRSRALAGAGPHHRLSYRERSGLATDTLVPCTGDNGSPIRVPVLAWAPGYIPAGSTADAMVRNIDIAPTTLDLAQVRAPEDMDGRWVLATLRWRDREELLYEYWSEHAFPIPRRPLRSAARGTSSSTTTGCGT